MRPYGCCVQGMCDTEIQRKTVPSYIVDKQDKLRKRQYSPLVTVRELKQIDSEMMKSVLH